MTLPKATRQMLGVVPGDRVQYVAYNISEVRIIPTFLCNQ